MKSVAAWLHVVRRFVRTIGPILLVELLLPGGTLLALLLLLYRSDRLRIGAWITAAVTMLVQAQVRVADIAGNGTSMSNPGFLGKAWFCCHLASKPGLRVARTIRNPLRFATVPASPLP